MVMDTADKDEFLVAAARFEWKHDTKVGHVDILCADNGHQEQTLVILRKLLQKIEHIGFSHGLNKIIIEIPQWRHDMEEFLTSCEYVELSGHMYPEDKCSELLKPTMILEFHKNLNPPEQKVNIVTAPEHYFDDTAEESEEYNDSDLLQAIESISITQNSLSNAGLVFDSADGGVTIDFDQFMSETDHTSDSTVDTTNTRTHKIAGEESVVSAIAAVAESTVEDNMEDLMDTLFKALHKTYDAEGNSTAAEGKKWSNDVVWSAGKLWCDVVKHDIWFFEPLLLFVNVNYATQSRLSQFLVLLHHPKEECKYFRQFFAPQ